MNTQVTAYLSNLLPRTEDWIKELEKQARDDNIPIMDPLGIHFLMQLIRLHKPRKILEIGAAIGYSALRMHEANPKATITTIERDEIRYNQAKNNIKANNRERDIIAVHGDAIEIMEQLKKDGQTFDCIFIDAAKGQYKRFFEIAEQLLDVNGIIISDNVLFRGYVSNPGFDHDRYKRIVEKLRMFNEWISNHPSFVTSIIPIGDGVAISIKK